MNEVAKRSPFIEHIREAKTRLLISFGSLIIGSIGGFFLHEQILTLLLSPIGQPLYFSSPSGGLDFTLKVSLFFGCLITIPIFIYQVLQFIGPAFSTALHRMLPIILVVSCVLLIFGMAFAYFVSLPAALYFLDRFSSDQIQSLISTTEYFSFVTRYILGFGVLFQLPLVLVVINKLKPISTKVLMSYQRWVVLGSFVLAGMLTPTPDPFNQLIMAVPLILLYQVSVITLLLINKKKR